MELFFYICVICDNYLIKSKNFELSFKSLIMS